MIIFIQASIVIIKVLQKAKKNRLPVGLPDKILIF